MAVDPGIQVDFFGLGGIRCASTWFATCLDEHPGITVAANKEPNVLVPRLVVFEEFLEPRFMDWEYYGQAFQHSKPDDVIGDFSVKLFHNGPVSAPLIKDYFPGAKFIVLLRDPVKRAYSHYWHHRSGKQGAASAPASFREALDYPGFVYHSRYYDQLSHWLEQFPLNRFHFVLDMDIKQNPETTVQDAYRFLGVDPNFCPPSLNRRINKASTRRGIADGIGRITSGLRSVGLGGLVNFARRTGIQKIPDRLDRKSVKVPPMDPADGRVLRDLLRDDIERLEVLINRDLASWKNDEDL